jgi:hypothetical protein
MLRQFKENGETYHYSTEGAFAFVCSLYLKSDFDENIAAFEILAKRVADFFKIKDVRKYMDEVRLDRFLKMLENVSRKLNQKSKEAKQISENIEEMIMIYKFVHHFLDSGKDVDGLSSCPIQSEGGALRNTNNKSDITLNEVKCAQILFAVGLCQATGKFDEKYLEKLHDTVIKELIKVKGEKAKKILQKLIVESQKEKVQPASASSSSTASPLLIFRKESIPTLLENGFLPQNEVTKKPVWLSRRHESSKQFYDKWCSIFLKVKTTDELNGAFGELFQAFPERQPMEMLSDYFISITNLHKAMPNVVTSDYILYMCLLPENIDNLLNADEKQILEPPYMDEEIDIFIKFFKDRNYFRFPEDEIKNDSQVILKVGSLLLLYSESPCFTTDEHAKLNKVLQAMVLRVINKSGENLVAAKKDKEKMKI